MRQAAELLEEALREAGGSMDEIGTNPLFTAGGGRPKSNERPSANRVKAAQEEIGKRTDFYRERVYLERGNGIAAAAEFQKILQHPGLVLPSPLGALTHLGLARAYGLNGYSDRNRAEYQDFFALWKDADPDIPILQQARAEYSKLQ